MSRSVDDGNVHAVHIGGDTAAPRGLELAGFLGRGQLGDTWLGRTATGAAVAAKRLRTGVGIDEVEALRRLCGIREPELLTVLGVELHDARVWMLGELGDGVTLRRLLAVAVLSPVQWVTVARSVLAGLAALHRRGLIHGAVHAGNVHVSGDGRVRLGDGGIAVPVPAPTDLETLQTHELSAAWTLLRGAGTMAARRPGWPPAMDHLLNGPHPADASDALRALIEAAAHLGDPDAAAGARMQLAALVVPLRRRPAPAPALSSSPVSVSTSAGAAWTFVPPPRGPRTALARGTRPQRRRARARRLLFAGLFCAVLGAVIVEATGHLAHRSPPPAVSGPVMHRSESSSAMPSPAPGLPAALPDLPILGPPSAGEVAAVSVEPLSTGCSPGATCTVTVRVDLSAHPLETVGWVLEIIDRCNGRRTEIEARPMTAPPWFVYVYSPTTLLIPATSASAIVALTTAPAHAASTPLLIPRGAASCVE